MEQAVHLSYVLNLEYPREEKMGEKVLGIKLLQPSLDPLG